MGPGKMLKGCPLQIAVICKLSPRHAIIHLAFRRNGLLPPSRCISTLLLLFEEQAPLAQRVAKGQDAKPTPSFTQLWRLINKRMWPQLQSTGVVGEINWALSVSTATKQMVYFTDSQFCCSWENFHLSNTYPIGTETEARERSDWLLPKCLACQSQNWSCEAKLLFINPGYTCVDEAQFSTEWRKQMLWLIIFSPFISSF